MKRILTAAVVSIIVLIGAVSVAGHYWILSPGFKSTCLPALMQANHPVDWLCRAVL